MLEPSFKVIPTGRRQLSKVGNIVLYETAFRIERTFAEGVGVHITQQNLIAESKSDEYMSIQDAHSMSGFSEEKLRELCADNSIEFTRDGHSLLISRKSLDQYIAETSR